MGAKKPLVIVLGAGASFGYSIDHMPPLTSQLVDPAHLDDELLKRYKPAAALLSELYDYWKTDGNSFNFEKRLKEIKDASGAHELRQKQFIALQYYLKGKFEKESKSLRRINTYKSLISIIETSDIPGVLVLSFNYDTLFEDSFTDRVFESMNSYVDGRIKIIKPHGSHNWAYIGESIPAGWNIANRDYQFLLKNPKHLEVLKAKDDVDPYHFKELDSERDARFIFPAIAVPIDDKHNFVCPTSHMDEARKILRETDKILIIGWKAGDKNILDEFKNNLPQRFGVLAVTRDVESAIGVTKTIEGLNPNWVVDSKGVGGGFSGLITSKDFKDFLRTDFI